MMRRSLLWTCLWIALALLFNAGVFYVRGPEAGLQFLAGYLIELSLSVDNLFVFLIIFSYFRIYGRQQNRILNWGIIGAVVLRILFILGGAALIRHFHWIFYVFGAFLVLTAFKLAFEKKGVMDPDHNAVIRLVRWLIPRASTFMIVLIIIDVTDVIFALDSIPAIFGITTDPFIVFTSNFFAILGLRSLYFVISGFMGMFEYLKYGLSLILAFVGMKMLIADWVVIPIGVSLGVVGAILMLSVAASLTWPQRK